MVQVGRPDDRLVKIRNETDDLQPFHKVSLGRNKVVAEYVNLFTLFFAFFIQLLYKQTQPFISIFVLHGSSLISTGRCYL